jgi:hypothetical protein
MRISAHSRRRELDIGACFSLLTAMRQSDRNTFVIIDIIALSA